MKTNEFHSLLRDWLTDYLPVKRHFSARTVGTYRQSFRMLRDCFRERIGIGFEGLTLGDCRLFTIPLIGRSGKAA